MASAVIPSKTRLNAVWGIMRTELIRGLLALVLVLSMVAFVSIVNGGEVGAEMIDTFVDDNGNIHEANIEYVAANGRNPGLQSAGQQQLLSVRHGYPRSNGCVPGQGARPPDNQ